MATNPSTTANLPCDQCGYLNEAERVYCHNCGAKLDRSLLPKPPERKMESPEETRKRVKKMTNPSSGGLGREIVTLFKVVLGSACVAALIMVGEKPDGVPEVKKELSSRMVSSDMMEAIESPLPRPVTFSEDEVNQYLKQTLKAKDGAIPGVRFERAFVNFTPGVIRISSEQSVWGYPVFSGVAHKLEIKNGKFSAVIVGGNFGRLQVDPRIMEYADAAFQKLWGALERERKQMDKMQVVVVKQGQIDLMTKGALR
jgi:hypothetical protein